MNFTQGFILGWLAGAAIFLVIVMASVTHGQPQPPAKPQSWPPADWPYTRYDFDFDGVVSSWDEETLHRQVGMRYGVPGFNAVFDLDGNGAISLRDLLIEMAQR